MIMQRSGSQKVLLVLSILKIVVAVLAILLGAATFITMSSVSVADLSSAAAEAGADAESVMAVGFIVGLAMIIGGLIDIILGILGIRAANNNQKIMPVWWLALIALILGVIGIIVSITQGTMTSNTLCSDIGSIIGSVLIFWIADNIKRQAGK